MTSAYQPMFYNSPRMRSMRNHLFLGDPPSAQDNGVDSLGPSFIRLFLAIITASMIFLLAFVILTSQENSSDSNSRSNGRYFPFFVVVISFLLAIAALRRYYSAQYPAIDQHDREYNSRYENLINILRSGGSMSQLDLTRLQIALTQRDFSPNDYDLLQQLDVGSNQQRGASEADIFRLPVHKVTSRDKLRMNPENRGCSICLEQFTSGDVVRTLPCLHIFHTQCIDTWLRTQATCPVCKFSAIG